MNLSLMTLAFAAAVFGALRIFRLTTQRTATGLDAPVIGRCFKPKAVFRCDCTGSRLPVFRTKTFEVTTAIHI